MKLFSGTEEMGKCEYTTFDILYDYDNLNVTVVTLSVLVHDV